MKPSNSQAQKDVELEILKTLGLQLNCDFKHDESIRSSHWNASPTVDGIDYNNKVICEIISRVGSTSASRDKKIMSDAMKLLLIDSLLEGGFKKIIVVVDPVFARKFSPEAGSWQALALSKNGIELKIIPLSDQSRLKIVRAQERQSAGIVKKLA